MPDIAVGKNQPPICNSEMQKIINPLKINKYFGCCCYFINLKINADIQKITKIYYAIKNMFIA